MIHTRKSEAERMKREREREKEREIEITYPIWLAWLLLAVT